MDPETETLAKSLKNSGLAASMEEAIKKAEDILSGKNKRQNISAKESKFDMSETQGVSEHAQKSSIFDEPGFEIAKEEKPLKEVVEEAETKGEPAEEEKPEEKEEPIEEEKAEEVKEQIEEEKEKPEEEEKKTEEEKEEKEKIVVEELKEEPIEEQPEEEPEEEKSAPSE